MNKDILLEDLDKFISNKAQEYQTDYSVAENLKKIAAYKVLLNINTKYVTVENGVSSNIDIDNFIIDFNKEIIKNKKLFHPIHDEEIIDFTKKIQVIYCANDFAREIAKISRGVF